VPGQKLTVADTLPDPPPANGRFSLAAVRFRASAGRRPAERERDAAGPERGGAIEVSVGCLIERERQARLTRARMTLR